jgi:hypothetical protein
MRCKRCGKRNLKRGVQFIFSDVATEKTLATYQVCWDCMTQHSPLIIPAELVNLGTVQQFSVSYETFENGTVH